MKGYLKLVLLVVLSTACAQDCNNWEPGDPAYHAHTDRCDAFIQCGNSGANVKYCQIGSLFNKDERRCYHSAYVIANRTCSVEAFCQNLQSQYQYAESCELYYQCTNATGVVDVEPRCCPPGQSWTSSAGCQNVVGVCTAKKYTHPDSCRSYYECANGALNTPCCGVNKYFNGTDCEDDDINDPRCTTPCVGAEETTTVSPVCSKRVKQGDPCTYITTSHGVEIEQRCPGGQGWDTVACTCSPYVPNLNTCPPVDTTSRVGGISDCLVYNATLQTLPIKNEEGYTYTGYTGITLNGGSLKFESASSLKIYEYIQKMNFMLRISVNVSSKSTDQVLVSNKCDTDERSESFTLAINTGNRAVSLRIGNMTGSYQVTSAQFPNQYRVGGDMLQVTMSIIDQGEDKLATLNLNGAGVSSSEQFKGGIQSWCPFTIGGFEGLAKDLLIWTDRNCKSMPPVNV